MDKPMKVCITGAHFTPAQAVIEELKSQGVKNIIYIGRKTTREGDNTPSVESEIIPKLGVKFIPIITGRLQRKFTRYTIPSLLKIPIGFLESFFILSREQPDAVLSFGGYVAVPVVLSAWLLSIPVIVHEQTLVTGLANSISNIFADKIAVSFPKDYSFDPKKVVLTGNPIRKEILNPSKLSSEFNKFVEQAKKEKLPLILVLGGNQGSHVINQAIGDSLVELNKLAFIIHATGDSEFKDFEDLEEKRSQLSHQERYLVKKWLGEDLGGVLERADLAVSRAGANTLTELSYFGVPSLLVPIPFASRDEQNTNAKYFKDLGLAEVLSQSSLTPKSLVDEVKKMIKSKEDLKKKAEKAKEVVIKDAAKRLTQETILLGS